MNLFRRAINGMAEAFSSKSVQQQAATGGPSIFQLTGRNSASSPRPAQGNLVDSLSRYADEAWIYACVRIIQMKGAEVPLRVYKMVNGKKTEMPNHPLQKLLDSVNPFMDRSQLMESTHGFKELAGNAFWLLDRFIGDKPSEIYPLNPAHMRPLVDKQKGLVGFEYRINGIVIQQFTPEEILHFHYWNPLDPFWGQPPISAGRDGADMIKRADQYNIAFFNNGAEAGGFLTTDKAMVQGQVDLIKAAWAKNHRGARKAHAIEILHGGLEWKSNSTSHKDMMFDQLKKMSREDVLGCYMVPPVMVGIHDDSNYSNADAQERIFWKFMKARLASIDSVLTERLGKPFDGVIVQHDLSQVQELQDDQRLKAQADQILVNSGIKTINEVRAEMALQPVAWGDVWFAPFGLTPISDKPDKEITPPPEDTLPPPAKVIALPAKKEEAAPVAPHAVEDPKKIARDNVWVRYKGLTERLESKWAPAIKALFNQQEKEVIDNARNSDLQKMINQHRLDKGVTLKTSLDVLLFDRTHSRSVFRKTAHGLIELTVQLSAQKEINDYDLGIDFNLLDANVRAWVNTKAFKFSEEVNQTTEEALRRELSEGIAAGEPLTQIEDRIAKVFDIARGPRTAMISRTEVISASNEGAFESYKQSGVVEKTEWISSRDNQVREEHQIDGEQADLGQLFTNGLKFPGDPAGEPGNVINCRCTIAPIVDKS